MACRECEGCYWYPGKCDGKDYDGYKNCNDYKKN